MMSTFVSGNIGSLMKDCSKSGTAQFRPEQVSLARVMLVDMVKDCLGGLEVWRKNWVLSWQLQFRVLKYNHQ